MKTMVSDIIGEIQLLLYYHYVLYIPVYPFFEKSLELYAQEEKG